MLKSGIYVHRHVKEYVEGPVYVGDIVLDVHETKTTYVLKLLEQNVRYDAPQIDSLFASSNTVRVPKRGSRHAMRIYKHGDIEDSFVLYPYRIGAPYDFDYMPEWKEK